MCLEMNRAPRHRHDSPVVGELSSYTSIQSVYNVSNVHPSVLVGSNLPALGKFFRLVRLINLSLAKTFFSFMYIV